MDPLPRSPRVPWLLALLTATAAAWSACAGGAGRSQQTDDGLAKVSTRGPGILYVKPGHPVGSYDDIMLASIGIHYAAGQKELAESDEDVILDGMEATIYERVAAGFQVAERPGPCTVKLGVYLKDVDFYESSGSGAQTRFISSYGAATLVFEFRDSLSDEPLVRYGQRRSFGAGVDAGSLKSMDLKRLATTLERMLEDAGDTLQEALAPEVAGRAAVGCNGLIGRTLAQR